MSSSSWGSKLEKKLNVLADGASKESLQTLANWVGFNRKHASMFGKTFCDALVATATTSETRQWLYWQALSEVLLVNHLDDPEKWERASDLRSTLGETAVIPALEGLGARVLLLIDKLEGLLKQWDNHNVFGGPTLIGQIRRLLTSASASSLVKGDTSTPPCNPDISAAAQTPAETTAPPQALSEAAIEPSPEKTRDTSKSDEIIKREEAYIANAVNTVDKADAASRRGSVSSLPGAEIEYDFEIKVRYIFQNHHFG